MSTTRRDFIKKSSLFMGGLTFVPAMPASITRALSIEAAKGSTFLDAEHIVFLMQENRSFDHCFGTLKGVRGFNDPRVVYQPNQLPVWFQFNEKNEIYGPFRLDIENTRATWLGGLPHTWKDMVAARNNGKMDNWLIAKKPSEKVLQHIPLTMGYFTRQDLPFYYAFADAFTVCDQHFCSSLTGTSANRSFFWSGTIREEPRNPESVAHVNNRQINYQNINWTTYPERLEKENISWRVYQNELSLAVGMSEEEENWLANFTDNNLEFYKQYNVRFHKAHLDHLKLELLRINEKLSSSSISSTEKGELERKKKRTINLLDDYNEEGFDQLSSFEQEIHKKAFTTNIQDPHYHEIEEVSYEHNGKKKKMNVPKGDILYQFRKDAEENKLPMVSWLVAPCNFSDHPSAPWFGAWYVSEVLDILTKNPEVWKKTIFILSYDENDGYFDHVAPFVPPFSSDVTQGKVPNGIETKDEWVINQQDGNENSTVASPIGLGYRVPLVVASPWTKGGWVNSEVFDLTSSLQFLEYFIEKKTGKKVIEENISQWRRGVCGNLTSVFQSTQDNEELAIDFVDRNLYLERILSSYDKALPGDYHRLNKEEILTNETWNALPNFPKQEEGVKKACALPYFLEVNSKMNHKKNRVEILFNVKTTNKTNKEHLIPFQVYSTTAYNGNLGANWNFAVKNHEFLNYDWQNASFLDGIYDLKVHSANGFYRQFKGDSANVGLEVTVSVLPNNSLEVVVSNVLDKQLTCYLQDVIYTKKNEKVILKAKQTKTILFDFNASKGWYDLVITHTESNVFKYHFAGHIENGKNSITDPYMASFSKL